MTDDSSTGSAPQTTPLGPVSKTTPRDLSVFGPVPSDLGQVSDLAARSTYGAFISRLSGLVPFIGRHLAVRESGPPGPAVLRLSSADLHALAFVHGHTDVFHVQPDEFHLTWFGARTHGTTTWVTGSGYRPCAWLAWDWVQLRSGVIMQANPLDLRSNIELLDLHGQRLIDIERMVHLNQVIHRLDWHAAVRRAT